MSHTGFPADVRLNTGPIRDFQPPVWCVQNLRDIMISQIYFRSPVEKYSLERRHLAYLIPKTKAQSVWSRSRRVRSPNRGNPANTQHNCQWLPLVTAEGRLDEVQVTKLSKS